MAKVYGYARVSTADQDLGIQHEALIRAGVNPDLIFSEKVTGTLREGREKLCRPGRYDHHYTHRPPCPFDA